MLIGWSGIGLVGVVPVVCDAAAVVVSEPSEVRHVQISGGRVGDAGNDAFVLVTYIIDIGVEGGVDDVDRLPEERGDLPIYREPV